MKYFVHPGSVVRTIWGKSDTVLFIFAGAAAEFSLNKAVDWLYFTGRLPADPIGRLFSTVGYAKQIIFAEQDTALAAIDRMKVIHSGVEASRGFSIPDYAYRDVLFMLIHYSIVSFELLERKLTQAEKEEVFRVFYAVGSRMGIPRLPVNYNDWQKAHQKQLRYNLQHSAYTQDLYRQYRKHLGYLRYFILLKVQSRIVPGTVLKLLRLRPSKSIKVLLLLYKRTGQSWLNRLARSILLPAAYAQQIKQLDQHPRS